MPCGVLPTAARFASSLVGYADCEARTIGQAGYQALAGPGALVPALLAILLTILVALVGYRLILGDTPSPREGVVTIAKIGIVLAFATGWSAYRPVIYDVALEAPAELAARIGGASGLPGGASLAAHLDAIDGQFQELAIENVNQPAVSTQAGPTAPPLFANFDVFALGSARIVFLGGALASYAAPRLLAGLLLALGPLFIAFLLFDATRGLVEAWLGLLAGTALASLAASIVLGVELALLEPWLASLIAQRVASEAIPGLPSELLVTVLVFDAVLLAAGVGLAMTAGRLRLAAARTIHAATTLVGTAAPAQNERGMTNRRQRTSDADRSRASAIAEAAATLHRRENAAGSRQGVAAGISGGGGGSGSAPFATNSSLPSAQTSSRRRTVPRRSNSATRRDRR